MSEVNSLIDLGFYGKLPTYGDFIQKRLPTDFINPWHEWLQSGMVACRERDPDGWMTYYLNCPAWNFVLARGICGDQAVAGVTIPSVDRVGRYFNFTMASVLPADVEPAVFAGVHKAWFEGLENVALSVLEEELDQDGIEALINTSAAELSWVTPAGATFDASSTMARVKSEEPCGVQDLLPELLDQLIAREQSPYSLWWHQGSSQVSAQLVSCAGLPDGDTYLGLMMDEDPVVISEAAEQAPEVDYMDEILSDLTD